MPYYRSDGPGPGGSWAGLWVLLGIIAGVLILMGIAYQNVPQF